jgi:hypothetical protein
LTNRSGGWPRIRRKRGRYYLRLHPRWRIAELVNLLDSRWVEDLN